MAENNDLILSRNALTTLEAARSYLTRDNAPTEDWAIADAVNEATAIMETRTRRRLRERLYINTQQFTCVLVADNLNAAVAGGGASVLTPGMDAVGIGLRPETKLDAIGGGGTSVTFSVPPSTAGSSVITFGSAPIVQRWPMGIVPRGSASEVSIDEFPVDAVYSINALETDGTKTAIDLTNMILRKGPGIVRLMNDLPAQGQFVEIECKAGYRPGTAIDRGQADDWRELRRICHRITQVLFQDYRHQLGRSLEVQIQSQIIRFADMSLPKDVIEDLAFYMREDV